MEGGQRIKMDGVYFAPAEVNDNIKVYDNPNFTIKKRSWQPDQQASTCLMCQKSFGQLRRKHHCRQCGMVFCDKCCHTKVPLPQLGESDPERICGQCLPVVTMVTKSYSPMPSYQHEAACGLEELCKQPNNIAKIVGLGGFHTLLALAKKNLGKNDHTIARVVGALHTLSTYEPLQQFMVDQGVMEALCDILNTVEATQEQILLDGVSTLSIFFKILKFKPQGKHILALPIVLNLCGNRNETVALVAVSALSQVVCHPETQTIIIESDRQSLQTLLALCASESEQMQAVAFKCLTFLSMGTAWYKHRIIQEDYTAGKPTVSVMKKQTKNMQVLCNAACLAANLAINAEDQAVLQESMMCLIKLLESEEISNMDLLLHVIRGIANFAKFKENSYTLLSVLPLMVRRCVKNENTAIGSHGLRAILNLLKCQPKQTTQKLLEDGAGSVLEQLVEIPGVMDAITEKLTSQFSELAKPL